MILCVCVFATTSHVAASAQCRLVNALPVMFIATGIYTMVAISVERVRCVLPTRGHAVATSDTRSIGIRGTIIVLAIVWMSSVILAVPAAVNFDVGIAGGTNSSNHSLVLCQSTWNSLQTSTYSLFVLCVSYLLPQIIIYVNYGRLAVYLWSRRRAVAAGNTRRQAVDTGRQTTRQGGGAGSATTPISRSTVNTIKMLVTIAVLFLASWAPYFTIMTIEVIRIITSCSTDVLNCSVLLIITSRQCGVVMFSVASVQWRS